MLVRDVFFGLMVYVILRFLEMIFDESLRRVATVEWNQLGVM